MDTLEVDLPAWPLSSEEEATRVPGAPGKTKDPKNQTPEDSWLTFGRLTL